MKTHKLIYGIGGILAVMLMAVLFTICLPVVAGVSMAVGTAIASPPSQRDVTGGDSYSESSEYIDMRDVQRKVEEYKPYQTPILTLLSNNKKETCESWEKKYFAIDARGMETTISSASTISGNSTTLTVADGTFFTKNNTVFISIGGAKINAGRTLQGIVTGIPETGKITVVLQNNAAGLVAGDLATLAIQRGGSAMPPKAASTGSWAMMPEPDYNYVQLFMEQVDIEDFQEKMKKQIDWNIADMKRGAIEDFKLQLERTFLNGLRGMKDVLVDGTNQRIYTCGGILQDTGVPVSSSITLSAMTEKVLNGIMKDIFTGNNGMKSRFLFGGADFIEALENITADKKYILAKETYSYLGVDYVKVVSMFGTLNVAYYEQMDLLGRPKDALVIDKSNISVADFDPFQIRELDLKTPGIAKVTSAVIEQTSTMLVKNKATHRILIGA
jgi:hypothetical protein